MGALTEVLTQDSAVVDATTKQPFPQMRANFRQAEESSAPQYGLYSTDLAC